MLTVYSHSKNCTSTALLWAFTTCYLGEIYFYLYDVQMWLEAAGGSSLVCGIVILYLLYQDFNARNSANFCRSGGRHTHTHTHIVDRYRHFLNTFLLSKPTYIHTPCIL